MPSPEMLVKSHNNVARIPIEERFLVTKPSEKKLQSKARKLASKLDKRFPNQRNIVVYNFTNEKRGHLLYTMGYLDV